MIDTRIQSVHDVLSGFQSLLTDALGKLLDIIGKASFTDINRLIGTEGRADHEFDAVVCFDFFVPGKIVDGIVRGSDIFDVGLLNDAAYRELRIILQHLGGLVPYFLYVIEGKGLGNAEIFFELQIAPVVHRITNRHFQSLRKRDKFVIGVGAAGHRFLGHAVRAHDPPFIVVTEIGPVVIPTAEPNLCDIVVPAVFVDFLRGDMTVIVDQRQIFSIAVKKPLCGFIFEHEILIHECFHLIVTLLEMIDDQLYYY